MVSTAHRHGFKRDGFGRALCLALLSLLAATMLLPAEPAAAQQPKAGSAAAAAAANDIAHFFSEMGDQIYEECIFELSPEQLEVQSALIQAYVQKGASSVVARRLAVKQIRPPELSDKCKRIKSSGKAPGSNAGGNPASNGGSNAGKTASKTAPEPPAAAPGKPEALPWSTTSRTAKKGGKAEGEVAVKLPANMPDPVVLLANKKPLATWDCSPEVDFVTIKHNGFPRKLTGGEICNPFQDVVNEVPPTAANFKLGYTIKTGRMFVISDDPQITGKTIAWAISGRDVCRNDPDPVCFAARAVGPLPPGEYSFAADKQQRVSWGPKTKRNVAAIYLRKLWHKELFTPEQTAMILSRGNIAIHVRLKGEMSEACLGLEPKGWSYVASLIKDGRASALNVYIDEPYPQIAGNPPVIVASSFSLTSLFK